MWEHFCIYVLELLLRFHGNLPRYTSLRKSRYHCTLCLFTISKSFVNASSILFMSPFLCFYAICVVVLIQRNVSTIVGQSWSGQMVKSITILRTKDQGIYYRWHHVVRSYLAIVKLPKDEVNILILSTKLQQRNRKLFSCFQKFLLWYFRHRHFSIPRWQYIELLLWYRQIFFTWFKPYWTKYQLTVILLIIDAAIYYANTAYKSPFSSTSKWFNIQRNPLGVSHGSWNLNLSMVNMDTSFL